jgi:hypothetical protein
MAQFTKVNGDFQPVLHLDYPAYTNSGINAVTPNVAVQPQGPKLDFFTATANGAVTGTQIAAGFQTVEQLATVMLYQYGNASNNTLAVGIYPAGAWTAATLQTALLSTTNGASWPTGSTVAAGASFTSPTD